MKFSFLIFIIFLTGCSQIQPWEGTYTTSKKLKGYFEVRLCIYKENHQYKYKKILFSDVGGYSRLQKGNCYVVGNTILIPDCLIFDQAIKNEDIPENHEINELPENFQLFTEALVDKNELFVENNILKYKQTKSGDKMALMNVKSTQTNQNDLYLTLIKSSSLSVSDKDLKNLKLVDKD